ncbi:MAG: ribonuclease HI family protein [Actinomycetota bacterium]|nr:ribonuclease HI family protein [Actinomycetota bacterium]
MKGVLHTDGGARGNPGPAGIGVVLEGENGGGYQELGRSIGEATNNVAEYTALIAGLELALERGISEIEIYVDSELIASQVKGQWKIKNDRLRALAARAQSLMDRFESASITPVRRHLNTRADELANKAMDEAATNGWPDRNPSGLPSRMALDLDDGLAAEVADDA